MFSIVATTTELDQTRWIYLSSNGRMMLSPSPVSVSNRASADRALALALDFYDWSVPNGHGRLVSMSGPMGYFRSHYLGPAGHGIRERLTDTQATAVRTAIAE